MKSTSRSIRRNKKTARRFEQLESKTMLAGDLFISEFMASNDASLLDEDGDSSDWIELANGGESPISLDGWHLTDSENEPDKWTLPNVTLQPGEHRIVFASNKNRANANSPLHTNFKLSADGEYLALSEPDGTIASEFASSYPAQQRDISYGIGLDSQTAGYFTTPTPGTPNLIGPLDTLPVEISISEIMYHPTSENDAEEFIELHNHSSTDVSLADWRLNRGVEYTFPRSTTLEAGGYLVVTSDPDVFAAKYPDAAPALGPWQGRLSNSGERIRLVDARDQTMDEVVFADEGDWSQRRQETIADFPTSGWIWSDDHDGGGKSLELIHPSQPNEFGQNWSASRIEQGTPGLANSAAADDIAPIIYDVQHTPIIPQSTDSVTVSMRSLDETKNISATLLWRIDGAADFSSVPMAGEDGLFSAAIPPHATGAIIEFYVQATDSSQLSRTWPAPDTNGQQVTNMLYQVDDAFDISATQVPGSPPIYYQIMTSAERTLFESANRNNDAQRHATLVVVKGGETEVRHSTSIRYRGSGSRRANPPNNRLNIPSDRPLGNVTQINLNVVNVADQVLGSLLFRLAGMQAAEAQPATMYSNGVNLKGNGYYAQLEPLGSGFIKNQFPIDDGGNLYNGRRPNESPAGGKGAGLAYFGDEPAPYVSYLKQTNAGEADWSDVIQLTKALNTATDEDYLTAIAEVIDVDQWLRHLAMNALLSNREKGLVTGDPLGDDYAMYRGIEDTRFVLVPHDLDSLFDGDLIERSLLLPRGVPALKRLLDHPQIRPRYYAQFEDLIKNGVLTEDTTQAIRSAAEFMLNETQTEKILKFLKDRSEFVLNEIAGDSLRVISDLPVVGEFPRTSQNATNLRGKARRDTQSITLNGRSATIDFSLPSRPWTALNIPLWPGVNRVLVESFSLPKGQGELIESQTIDIWRDTGSQQDVGGTLPAGETIWSAAAGPYHVTSTLTVPSDARLTIQPGTSVYVDDGAKIDVRGILSANGSKYERIRFTSVPNAPLVPNRPNGSAGLPDGPPHWNGIQFQNSTSQDNVLAFTDIEYAQDVNGAINVNSSEVRIDNVSFRGTHLRMIRSNNASLTIENSYFPDMFAADESPAALGLDNVAEHIKASGKPPAGGHFVIRNNYFGTNKGHNDVIDADSGRRPDPILQVLDNVFMGAGDEQLDLGGDAYIAGNHFMNVFKDDETSDRGYANAISTGDAGSNTTVVVARNTFWEVDHAINLKRATATIFENNTVVGIHPDFDDRFGNPNRGGAINFFVDEPNAVPGWGAYVARNIFFDAPRVFSNADVGTDKLTPLELNNNLLASNLATQMIGNREGTVLDLGLGNIIGDPRFADVEAGDFTLQSGSAALRSSQNKIGWGANVSPEISIWGEPTSTTGQRSVSLHVGGPGIFAFRYSVNGGAWTDAIPIGTLGFDADGNRRTGTIELADLTDGVYSVEVVGQDFAGEWQQEPTVSNKWQVQTSSHLILTEVLASNSGAFSNNGSTPDYIEIRNIGGTPVNLNGYQLTDDATRRDKFTFAQDIVVQPNEFLVVLADDRVDLPGIHTGFALDADGETVALSDTNGNVLDTIQFGHQVSNLSVSRIGPGLVWQLSTPTPGMENAAAKTGAPSTLRINEWSAGNSSTDDFIELYNPDSNPVALDGLFLTDELAGNPRRQRLQPLSFVGANAVRALFANEKNDLEFGLSANGEILALLDKNGQAIDVVSFFSPVHGVSQGRTSDGAVSWQYFVSPTPNKSNTFIPGDIDRDGSVGFSDFLILSANFAKENAVRAQGDFDGDGLVGFADFLILSSNFGK